MAGLTTTWRALRLGALPLCALLMCVQAMAAPAKRAAAPGAATPAGFTVEPVPAWVVPMAADPAQAAGLPRAAMHILLIDHQTRVDRDGEAHFRHAVRQINEPAGLEGGAQLEIEFDPSYETLALHRIEVWRNGARLDRLDRRKVKLLQRETQLERRMIDGRLTASVVLEDVRIGDRVEFAYTLRGANPVFEGKFVDTEWTLGAKGPAALVQYRLLAPEGRAIRVVTAPDRAEVKSEPKAGWRDTRVRRVAAPQFQYDGSAPDSIYLADQIQLSEFADWGEVAHWAARVFSPSGAPAPELQAQADALRREAGADSAEQIRRTLDFVQTEVRYFGTEIGANTHRPAAPERVLQQRFGDCKDKVALLIALLKAQGIAASPLLVSTGLRDDVALMSPSPLAFNHAIARVQHGGQAWVLDGTRAHQTGPLAERQSTHLGRGLLADAGSTGLLTLPDAKADLRLVFEDKLVFDKISDDPMLDAQLTYHGDFAESLRAALATRPAAELEKQFVDDYGRYYPALEPEGPMQVDEVAGHNAVRIRLRFKLPHFLRLTEHKQLIADYGLLALTQTLRLSDQAPRTQPLQLASAGIYRHVLDIRFPEEVFKRNSNQRTDEANANFELHTQTEGLRDGARITGEVRVLNERVAAADWTRYRDTLIKIWPRLSGSITVPLLSAAQAERLTERMRQSDDDIRRGQSTLKTSAQVEALYDLWLAEARLASGRLPARHRVPVLVDRGIHLDHLNRLSEAAAAFDEALKIDPRSVEAHAALSVNALLRQQDALAVEHATQALQLAPGDNAPRYTRAYAHYMAGRPAQAREDLVEILKNRSDVDRGYATLWLQLTTKRLGGDAAAATQPYRPSELQPGWPHPVVKLLDGSGTLAQAMDAAQADKQAARGRLCELYFFLGQQYLLDGKLNQAADSFQKAVGTGVAEFTEYGLAVRELERLKAR